MSDPVKICNLALGLLSQKSITSLSDNSLKARVCNIYYEQVVDAVLRSNDWNSAMCQAQLPAEATAPIWEYANQYPLPSGTDPLYPYCLRVIKLEAGNDWEVRGRKILTDYYSPLKITYIGRVKEDLFDPMLVDAIAASLAVKMANEFTESGAKVQLAESLRLSITQDARIIDSKESRDSIIDSSNWINSRY